MAFAHGAESVDFDRIGRKTPLLVDLKPSGLNYMEDLYKASTDMATFLNRSFLLAG